MVALWPGKQTPLALRSQAVNEPNEPNEPAGASDP